MRVDPATTFLSEHLRLSDFLGCNSVYSKGYKNVFSGDEDDPRLDNARSLCQTALEPLMRSYGPLSISYGFIDPELSRHIVKYQDPDKPSHHRWDLGAAADVLFHDFVSREPASQRDITAPIGLAHQIEQVGTPYSRLITYSESPYLCLALSAAEIEAGNPRKAFYENRFLGVPKVKPQYLQYSSPAAKQRAAQTLEERGLPHPWQGGGYPSYHGGGFRQAQHIRVSKYTMVSDWLINLKSIALGEKNPPDLTKDSVQDSFAAAGLVYDRLLDVLGVPHLSILQGFIHNRNSNYATVGSWYRTRPFFRVGTPYSLDAGEVVALLKSSGIPGTTFTHIDTHSVGVLLDVDAVLAAL